MVSRYTCPRCGSIHVERNAKEFTFMCISCKQSFGIGTAFSVKGTDLDNSKTEILNQISGNSVVGSTPPVKTIQLDVNEVTLRHKELHIDVNLTSSSFANIDKIIINGHEFVRNQVSTNQVDK